MIDCPVVTCVCSEYRVVNTVVATVRPMCKFSVYLEPLPHMNNAAEVCCKGIAWQDQASKLRHIPRPALPEILPVLTNRVTNSVAETVLLNILLCEKKFA